MSRKPVQSRKARAAVPAGDGLFAGLVDRVFDNPASSGGLMVVALTATAIISNAMFLQSGHHPDPLFMTRPATAQRAPARPVVAPVPVLRPAAPIVVPPLPRLSPLHNQQTLAPEPVVAPVAQPDAIAMQVDAQAQLTTEIQRELARLGLYSGAIDGVTGPRTAAAISAYETAAGREVTGLASPDLLASMSAPLPPRGAQAAPATDATETAALDQREQSRAQSIAAEEQARLNSTLRQNYRIVQAALNRTGYGPIPVNGFADEATADAIRRFELDNGLPLIGEATDELIGHMIAIGAIKPT